ncbi:MAG TPA: response regulator [Ktedonobacterales bacterium]|nr:response regulator [Ktedonobacterales bacterium]
MNTSGHDSARRITASGRQRQSQPLAVLFVDPDIAAAERLASPLRARWAIAIVPSAQAALAAMQLRLPSVVVTELDLPDQSGVELLAHIHNTPVTHNVLLMVVTGRASVRDKIAAFQAGADDYLVKPVDPQQFEMHLYLVSRFRSVIPN